MDNSRTLPPLVRGKVTGVLNFFIDEIKLSRNVQFLTDDFDITAQVQWWGEILPAYIRPKILQLQDKIRTGSQSSKVCFHSAQYEIKTAVELLKSYLKACEILELSVFEAVKNYVIGSAFLKNLTHLLNKTHEFIVMPIIDYSGEEIGHMKIHIDFFEYPQDDKNDSLFENKTNCGNLGTLERKVSELLKSNYVFPAEKTVFYDGCSKVTNFELESDQDSEFDKYLMKDKNNTSNLVLSNLESKEDLNNHLINPVKELSKCVNHPKVCVSRDSSKILNFDLKIKKSEKITESNLPNKFSSNSIKCKSKPKTEKSNVGTAENTGNSKKLVMRNQVLKNSKMATENVMDLKVPPTKPSSEMFSNKYSELESISGTCANKKVFDYLLGSDMSKENEESALKDFKKMSPSHDIVSSINELCLTSDKTKIYANKCMKHNLCFDLTNPIERNYYEKFFVTNNSNEFEIAELLNEPENNSALGKWKSNSRNIQKHSPKFENRIFDETQTRKGVDFVLDNPNRESKQNGCARCKYYKKLDELDTIIESLKHFEKNMLKQEKRMQLDFEGDSLVRVRDRCNQ